MSVHLSLVFAVVQVDTQIDTPASRMCPQPACCVCAWQVRDSLMARAKEFNILVDDIAITHLSFGTEVRSHLVDMP